MHCKYAFSLENIIACLRRKSWILFSEYKNIFDSFSQGYHREEDCLFDVEITGNNQFFLFVNLEENSSLVNQMQTENIKPSEFREKQENLCFVRYDERVLK